MYQQVGQLSMVGSAGMQAKHNDNQYMYARKQSSVGRTLL